MNVIIPPHPPHPTPPQSTPPHPTPPQPTPAVIDDERTVPLPVPVCVQEHERYYPTPPHATPAVIRMFRNLTAASDRFITSDKGFTAASDAILLPQVTGKSHCRK